MINRRRRYIIYVTNKQIRFNYCITDFLLSAGTPDCLFQATSQFFIGMSSIGQSETTIFNRYYISPLTHALLFVLQNWIM